jgi:hypothetical protein
MGRKKTYEEVKYFIEVESGSGCKLLSTEYVNTTAQLNFKCKCGKPFKKSYNTFKNKENSRMCKDCWNILNPIGNRRLKYEDVKNYIENESNTGCKLISTEYLGNSKKLIIECKCGTTYERTLGAFKNGGGQCHDCTITTIYNKCAYTIEEIKYFVEIESNIGCKLLSTEYIDNSSKLTFKCKCGNKFETTFSNFKGKNKRVCNNCSLIIRAEKRKYSYEEVKTFVERLGYELISKEYINCNTHLILKDKEGFFYTISFSNLQKEGYRSGRFNTNNYTIYNIKLWCKLNDKSFELISEEFKGSSKKLKWKCLKNECGEIFEASWNAIYNGQGCGYCAGKQVGISNCLATKNPRLASEWHPIKNGDLTPWDVTPSSNKYVWWICEEGHERYIAINSRNYSGCGCSECSKDSKGELRIQEILTKYNIPQGFQHKFKDCKAKRKLPFDISTFKDVDKINLNILIEYDGHQHFYPVNFGGMSNDKAEKCFKRNQRHDLIKNNYCIANNIPLLRIPYWEFKNIEEILVDILINNNMSNEFFIHNQISKEIVS